MGEERKKRRAGKHKMVGKDGGGVELGKVRTGIMEGMEGRKKEEKRRG